MIEIIAIILLSLQISKMAIRKGLKSWPWVVYMILAWIVGEFIGAFIAILAFKADTYISLLPMAIMGAVGGYLVVRAILSNKPDKPDDSFEFENRSGE